jgi:starvation-inducible DNA-binding protein
MSDITFDLVDDGSSEELARELAELLADVVNFKFFVHGLHWNVKGHDFREMHAFFGEIYEDADGSIDDIAENILKSGYDAPYLLSDYIQFANFSNPPRITSGDKIEMVTAILAANQIIIQSLNDVFAAASALNEQGIMNFIADRIDHHKKWNWQLSATIGVAALSQPLSGLTDDTDGSVDDDSFEAISSVPDLSDFDIEASGPTNAEDDSVFL